MPCYIPLPDNCLCELRGNKTCFVKQAKKVNFDCKNKTLLCNCKLICEEEIPNLNTKQTKVCVCIDERDKNINCEGCQFKNDIKKCKCICISSCPCVIVEENDNPNNIKKRECSIKAGSRKCVCLAGEQLSQLGNNCQCENSTKCIKCICSDGNVKLKGKTSSNECGDTCECVVKDGEECVCVCLDKGSNIRECKSTTNKKLNSCNNNSEHISVGVLEKIDKTGCECILIGDSCACICVDRRGNIVQCNDCQCEITIPAKKCICASDPKVLAHKAELNKCGLVECKCLPIVENSDINCCLKAKAACTKFNEMQTADKCNNITCKCITVEELCVCDFADGQGDTINSHDCKNKNTIKSSSCISCSFNKKSICTSGNEITGKAVSNCCIQEECKGTPSCSRRCD